VKAPKRRHLTLVVKTTQGSHGTWRQGNTGKETRNVLVPKDQERGGARTKVGGGQKLLMGVRVGMERVFTQNPGEKQRC